MGLNKDSGLQALAVRAYSNQLGFKKSPLLDCEAGIAGLDY